MKKILLAIALIITIGSTANAQTDAFFNWNLANDDIYRSDINEYIVLPNVHGDYLDNSAVPLGSGLLILTAMGTGYAVANRKKGKSL